ncbi:MAG: glycosyltransferase [Eubacterium sp.]|nr:glycosyltransferase [Eubacterium sp.]
MLQEQTDLVSVIVPHYKVPLQYVDECINSIVCQTYRNLEILLIDDGNEKELADQLDKYEACDDRIRVIHQENAGVSCARNHGMSESSGKWIVFCDPDDYMALDEVEVLLNAAKREQVDIVFAGYHKLSEKDNDEKADICKILEHEELGLIVRRMLKLYPIKLSGYNIGFYTIWGKIYRADVIRDIRFPEGIHPDEDSIFNIYALSATDRVACLNQKLHYYRDNWGNGCTSVFRPNGHWNHQRTRKEIKRYIENKYGSMKDYYSEKELAELCMQELAWVCRQWIFNRNNPRSYEDKKKELFKYISKMPHYENVKMDDLCTPKYILLFFLIRHNMILPVYIYGKSIKAT